MFIDVLAKWIKQKMYVITQKKKKKKFYKEKVIIYLAFLFSLSIKNNLWSCFCLMLLYLFHNLILAQPMYLMC